jgi:hypothetical protein
VGESPVSNGEAHRWKAPRVRRNASLFAEWRGKRPWRRWMIAKAISFPGGLASSTGYQREPRELHAGPAGCSFVSTTNECSVGLAQAGPPGELETGTRQHVCAQRCWPLQPVSRRAARRQVSEPIGSGRSSRCEQSRREAPGTAKASWPLTRDTSAGSLDGAAGDHAQA